MPSLRMDLQSRLSSPGFQQIITRGFLPGDQPNILGQLVGSGLNILEQFVSSRFGAGGGGGGPSLAMAATAAAPSLASILPTVAAAGGAIVGNVIRISRAGWARIPAAVKQIAAALGLTVLFTDISVDVPGFGGDGQLSQVQQRRLERFQQMTGAGVPPGIAARASGIGRKPRRGLSFFEIRGFSKITRMLSRFGAAPRGLAKFRRRRGKVC